MTIFLFFLALTLYVICLWQMRIINKLEIENEELYHALILIESNLDSNINSDPNT